MPSNVALPIMVRQRAPPWRHDWVGIHELQSSPLVIFRICFHQFHRIQFFALAHSRRGLARSDICRATAADVLSLKDAVARLDLLLCWICAGYARVFRSHSLILRARSRQADRGQRRDGDAGAQVTGPGASISSAHYTPSFTSFSVSRRRSVNSCASTSSFRAIRLRSI